MLFRSKNKVIVLGNQKSGTTAIAALLAEYTGMSVMLDVADIYKVHTGEMRFREFVKANRNRFTKQLLKEPMFTFMFDDVAETFPNARFLFIVRDPRDAIRSLLNRLDIQGDLEEIDTAALETMNVAWRKVFEKKWLKLKGDTYIEVLAARWNFAADVYLNNKDKMVLVKYEDFISDKIRIIKDTAALFGLKEMNDISGKLDVQFQPKGNKEITWSQFYGDGNREKIETICANRMSRFGYILTR